MGNHQPIRETIRKSMKIVEFMVYHGVIDYVTYLESIPRSYYVINYHYVTGYYVMVFGFILLIPVKKHG